MIHHWRCTSLAFAENVLMACREKGAQRSEQPQGCQLDCRIISRIRYSILGAAGKSGSQPSQPAPPSTSNEQHTGSSFRRKGPQNAKQFISSYNSNLAAPGGN
jgi:hypothetical protein